MGDYYGGYSNNGNNSGGGAPNFSVPPPAFQGGPGQNYPQSNPFERNAQPAPPQQGNNWGPPGGRDNSSPGAYTGGYQGRQNSRGGSSSYGSNPRSDSYGGGERKNNFSGGNSNKSGYNKDDGGSGDMVTQEDTIFVSGMDTETTEDEIANHFGAIGIIKKDKKTMKPKVWLYRHKESGESKGEATITYDDPNAAQSAISWFDSKKLNGAVIHVSLAQRQNTWQKGGGFRGGSRGGGMRGGPGASRGGYDRGDRDGGPREDRDGGRNDDRGRGPPGGGNRNQREGDWTCSGCNNTNFAWRNECNRCKEPKAGGNPGGASASAGGYRGGQDRGGSRSGPGQDRGGSFNRSRDQGPMRGNGDRNDRNRPY